MTNNNNNKDEIRKEIRSVFDDAGFELSSTMLKECANLSLSLSIAPKDLLESWEAYSLNKNVSKMTNEVLKAFHQSLTGSTFFSSSSSSSSSLGSNTKTVEMKNPGRAVVLRRRVTTKTTTTSDQSPSGVVVTPSPKRAKKDSSNESSMMMVDDEETKKEGTTTKDGTDTTTTTTTTMTSTMNTIMTLTRRKPHSTKGPKYQERQNVGKIVSSYVGSLVANVSFSPSSSSSSLSSRRRKCIVDSSLFHETNVNQMYRYGYSQLEVRAKALDDHLVNLGNDILQSLEGVVSQDCIAPVGVPRQEQICCVGRICNEAHEGRINKTCIVLEGSRHESGGKRIRLNLDNVSSSFSLFSGQIVAVEGINASNKEIVVTKIHEGVVLSPSSSTTTTTTTTTTAAPTTTTLNKTCPSSPFCSKVKTPVTQLIRYHHKPLSSENNKIDVKDDIGQEGTPLSIWTASGPFTTSDNLHYEPLNDLLNHVLAERPDVVILSGPFVDVRHASIASGNVELEMESGDDGTTLKVTYEVFFANRIATLLEQVYEGRNDLQTQFVLIPSLDDAVGTNVYPQPPFLAKAKNSTTTTTTLEDADELGIEFGSLGLHYAENIGRTTSTPTIYNQRIHCFSNPCTFQINEVVFGITSTDVIHHISLDETNWNLKESRISRITKHLLFQQSYYPMFPPPPPSTSAFLDTTTVNLDLKFMEKWNMPCIPDVLIVPSKLTTFCKNIDDCCCVVVNPGLLSRGTTGGTFAKMEIYPLPKERILEEQKKKGRKEERIDDDHDDDDDDHDGDEKEARMEIDHYVHERIKINVQKI